jgi:hypothetical protein
VGKPPSLALLLLLLLLEGASRSAANSASGCTSEPLLTVAAKASPLLLAPLCEAGGGRAMSVRTTQRWHAATCSRCGATARFCCVLHLLLVRQGAPADDMPVQKSHPVTAELGGFSKTPKALQKKKTSKQGSGNVVVPWTKEASRPLDPSWQVLKERTPRPHEHNT